MYSLTLHFQWIKFYDLENIELFFLDLLLNPLKPIEPSPLVKTLNLKPQIPLTLSRNNAWQLLRESENIDKFAPTTWRKFPTDTGILEAHEIIPLTE